ncbi:hypothetical protein PLESTB_000098300 [Pleodorina starrii]|uniref:G-patch domain-containing protein n=1 Tax=Pleodorina starrii TaxID=330485 RepID=A0A9W6BB79_9CHLO|nr:hypothetical protein PLESTB_000098300 [Pleodorina starrii]GLC71763.1 hypothetical protein PLESTF_001164000 [Pleodorina starrii]
MARSEPSPSDTTELSLRSGLAAFKSSGIHVLDPYISPPALRSTQAQGTCNGRGRVPSPGGTGTRTHGGPEPAGYGAPSFHGTVWTGHIPADNVGFRLLKKAGWSVGTGLGAESQGRREPIEPVLPKGTRGLGFDSRAQQQQQQQHSQQEPRQGRKRAAGIAPEGGDAAMLHGAAGPGSGRVAEMVREELARESLGVKVARHKQLMRTEQEQQRGRAIERYLRSAFNDPFDSLRSDNSNPLSRPHKLTASNPLLDPIGE